MFSWNFRLTEAAERRRRTMMALTMSFWLFLSACTALDLDTPAWDMTNSTSFASTPLSSIYTSQPTQTTSTYLLPPCQQLSTPLPPWWTAESSRLKVLSRRIRRRAVLRPASRVATFTPNLASYDSVRHAPCRALPCRIGCKKVERSVEQFVLEAPHRYRHLHAICMYVYRITETYLPPGRGSISRPYPRRRYDRYSVYPPIKDERLSRPEPTQVNDLPRCQLAKPAFCLTWHRSRCEQLTHSCYRLQRDSNPWLSNTSRTRYPLGHQRHRFW